MEAESAARIARNRARLELLARQGITDGPEVERFTQGLNIATARLAMARAELAGHRRRGAVL